MKKLYMVLITNRLEFELFQSIVLSLGLSWFEFSAVFSDGVAKLIENVVHLNERDYFPFYLGLYK